MNKQDQLIEKYKHHFKHLRILKNIRALHGELWVEAETPDGRFVYSTVDNNHQDTSELERLLNNWSPKG